MRTAALPTSHRTQPDMSNHLTGEVPPRLGRLPHLRRLELQRNFFQGALPDEMGLIRETYYHGQGTMIGLRQAQRTAQQHLALSQKRKHDLVEVMGPGILNDEPDRAAFSPLRRLNEPLPFEPGQQLQVQLEQAIQKQ